MFRERREGNNIYDSVFCAIIERTSACMIYLINEVFSEKYDSSQTVSVWRNNFFSKDNKYAIFHMKISDACYYMKIGAGPDRNISVNRIKLNAMDTLRNTENESNAAASYSDTYILHLHCNDPAPDHTNTAAKMPDAPECTDETPVIHVQAYSLDELFQKKLFIFLPYYICRYDLDRIESDADKRMQLAKEYEYILSRLCATQDLPVFERSEIIKYTMAILYWLVQTRELIKKEIQEMHKKSLCLLDVDETYDLVDVRRFKSELDHLLNHNIAKYAGKE